MFEQQSIHESAGQPSERIRPVRNASAESGDSLSLCQLLEFLPSLRLLTPLREALLARSCSDQTNGWTLGGDYATLDSRVIFADDIERVVGETARSEARVVSALFEDLGQALKARAGGRPQESATILRNAAVTLADDGRHYEAAALLEVALRDISSSGDSALAADVTRRLAKELWRTGRLERAADFYHRACKLFQATGNHVGEIISLQGLGNVRASQGRWRQAEAEQRHALKRCGADDDLYRGQIFNNLSQINRRLGALAEARACQQKAEAIWEKYDITAERVIAYNNAGLLALEERNPAAAREALLKGLSLAASHTERCVLVVNLAHVALRADRLDEAEHLAREAEECAILAGSTDILIDAYTVLGCVGREHGDEHCSAFFEKALDLAREGRFSAAQVKVHLEYARHLRLVGEPEEAISHLESALQLHDGVGDTLEREQILQLLRELSR